MKHPTPPALAFLEDELARARDARLLRERPVPVDPGPLSFCSNDYLGLAALPAPPEASGVGAAALVGGFRTVHAELERASAAWVGLPSALLLSSGYAANLGLVSGLARAGDLVVSDQLNHASIVDGARLSRARVAVVPHLDVGAVDRALASREEARAFVVTESYFSMDADSPDLARLRAVCDARDAALLVDESHALGVLGPDGHGLCAAAGIVPDALVGTYGKAFGAAGAFVAGSEALTLWLCNRARSYVFSTGMSPVLAATAIAGLRRAATQPWRRDRVLAMAARLRTGMEALGLRVPGHGPIVPWVLGAPEAAVARAALLRRAGLDVRAIRPPTVPAGTARIRLTVTARHGEGDVDRALELLSARDGRPSTSRPPVARPLAPLVLLTGTATEIGKTHLAEALLLACGAAGLRAVGLKPIESGVGPGVVTDVARLAAASPFHVKHEGVALAAPVSPHLAARAEGRALDLDRLAAWIEQARREAELVVVELPGGALSPLFVEGPGRSILNADFGRRLSPTRTVLFAPDRLGVLHDAVAATRGAAASGLTIDLVVLGAPAAPDASTGTNAGELASLLTAEVIATVPRGAPAALAASAPVQALLARLRQDLSPGDGSAP